MIKKACKNVFEIALYATVLNNPIISPVIGKTGEVIYLCQEPIDKFKEKIGGMKNVKR